MIGVLQILGGLALFMFGIHALSSAMEKIAGDQIQKLLGRATSNRLKSAGFGAIVTAILQSSGLLMVTMIGLINANLMNVTQAISVMLGQEIGTTITAQIVAFDIGPYRLLLVIVGIILFEFFPQRDWKKYGELFMGLGLIFVGMSYMATALDYLVEIPAFADLLSAMSIHPYLGIVIGMIVTAITQSSTAVTSMVVAMGISQVITLDGAIGVILGANIGSCITGFMASLRLSHKSRQASMAQIIMNVFGVLLFMPLISQFSELIARTSSDLPRQIANAHTVFNLAVSAILFPFVNQLTRISAWLTPADRRADKIRVTEFIDEMQIGVPSVALNEAARELTRMADMTANMLRDSCMALIRLDAGRIRSVLFAEDNMIDPIYKDLVSFINKLITLGLNLNQQKRCFQLKNLLIDIERIGDMAEDLAQYAQERLDHQVPFTQPAIDDLENLWTQAHRNYLLAIHAFSTSNPEEARQVCRYESDFDKLYWHSRQAHIQRIKEGVCQSEADVIFTETLRILERVSDHADNIGVSVARSLAHTVPARAS